MKGTKNNMKCFIIGRIFSRDNYDNSCYLRVAHGYNLTLFKVYKTLKNGEPNPLYEKVQKINPEKDFTLEVNHYFKDGLEKLYLYDVQVL